MTSGELDREATEQLASAGGSARLKQPAHEYLDLEASTTCNTLVGVLLGLITILVLALAALANSSYWWHAWSNVWPFGAGGLTLIALAAMLAIGSAVRPSIWLSLVLTAAGALAITSFVASRLSWPDGTGLVVIGRLIRAGIIILSSLCILWVPTGIHLVTLLSLPGRPRRLRKRA